MPFFLRPRNLYDLVLEPSKLIDFRHDAVTRLELDRRGSPHSDTCGGTGQDQVSRHQREDVRQVGDQLIDPKDELVRARILKDLAVHRAADA